MKMRTIEDLPEEILLLIFSKLNLCNIIRAGETCRKWRNLSMDVKTLQCIAKRAFDCKEWLKNDFYPNKEHIYHAQLLGIFPLSGMK